MSDADMKELAQEEYAAAKADLERLEEEIRILLLPRDPDDDKNVIVEIRAGVGGEEAALFAHSCSACIPCMPMPAAGRWRWTRSTRRSLEG